MKMTKMVIFSIPLLFFITGCYIDPSIRVGVSPPVVEVEESYPIIAVRPSWWHSHPHWRHYYFEQHPHHRHYERHWNRGHSHGHGHYKRRYRH